LAEITVRGVRLRYALEGPEGAPVVAFSNSLGATLEMWDALLPALGGRYRTLRYDTRGHGGSATEDKITEVADLADDLAGLLDALSLGRAHCVGLSLGGMTVQSMACRRPDLVASATLMATAAHLPSEATWEERGRTVRAQGTSAVVEATLGRWFTPGFAGCRPDVVAAVRERFVACDPAGYAVCCSAIGRMDLRPNLAALSAPTLVIAGREDPSTPPAKAEEICAHVPQAELVVLPRAAHLLAVERSDAAGAYLRAFLDRCEG
jgi:3-oxoadipate enol-lactonase/3-oxoadipate enol-lactonase/4-carboxymuconolactone decarboxylase